MSIFSKIAVRKPKSSRFNLTHDRKFSMKVGRLTPSCVMEAMPGDIFSIDVENMIRFAPLVSPVMHRFTVDTHFFFVPNRIIWGDWEKFITMDPTFSGEHPYISGDAYGWLLTPGKLGDYLGYNQPGEAVAYSIKYNALPYLAYMKIYDEWYRDAILQQPLSVEPHEVPNGECPPVIAGYISGAPLPRAWRHDYFTSALPFPQQGPEVLIPLFDEQGNVILNDDSSDPPSFVDDQGNVLNASVQSDTATSSIQVDGNVVELDPGDSLIVDPDDAATIRSLRRAIKLQEWFEKQYRGGVRYVETVLSHFGVRSSDARLQRPELIHSAHQNMVISEVLSTAQTADGVDTTPLGEMGGHGISVGGSARKTYKVEEHGWIIGIISVRPDTAYQQGLHRTMIKNDPFDYAFPTFAHIGEQPIYVKELYLGIGANNNMNDPAELDEVFGYIPRYSEYKFMNNTVHGEFKDSLAHWHAGRIFNDKPVLDWSFLQSSNSDNRIFAVPEQSDHLYCHVINKISVIRKLPKYTNPSI